MGELTVDDRFVAYLATRDQERRAEVNRLVAMMTKRERALVREVAVHAYVRGLMAGRGGEQQPPKDSETLFWTLLGCLSMDDLNPTIARLSRRAERLHARAEEAPDAG